MGWKNITKASISYNLSKEWFWSNDDEYERIMKADDKKVETGTTDLGDKIKDYESMLDGMLDSIKNMDGKTISGDDIKTSYVFLYRRNTGPNESPLDSILNTYSKLIDTTINNFKMVQSTSTDINKVHFRGLTPIMDHNYGFDNFFLISGDIDSFPMLFASDYLNGANGKILSIYTPEDKEGALNTEGNFAIPETITINASKCTSELQKLKRQLDTISRFKFHKHIPNFKIDSDSLSDDSDYDDNLSSYRENIHGLFMSTFEILLEGSIKLIHKALGD